VTWFSAEEERGRGIYSKKWTPSFAPWPVFRPGSCSLTQGGTGALGEQRSQRYLLTIASMVAAIFLGGVNSNAADRIVLTRDTSHLPTGVAYLSTNALPPRCTRRTVSSVAAQHILVKIGADVDDVAFLDRAYGFGLHKRKRVSGTNW
jgi:hypothetical protein